MPMAYQGAFLYRRKTEKRKSKEFIFNTERIRMELIGAIFKTVHLN